jgi:hypothetical protein
MAIITFSVKTSQEKLLESFLKEGESLNLCAKRLLLERLEGNKDESLDENIDDSKTALLSDRLTILEQKLEQVLADRENLLMRIANQQNQHLEDIKQIYKDANDLNAKLEQENYQLQKYNDDAQRENDFLESRRSGMPISDPQYVMLLEKRLSALEAKLLLDRPQIDEGLTSHQLAEVLKVDRSTISRWKQKGDSRLLEWEFKDGKWYKQS